MKRKVISIIGEIDSEAYANFREELQSAGNARITIVLNSTGGSAMDAQAIAHKIRRHRSPITIEATGEICSAAVVILAAGHKRRMTSSCWLMMHEEQGKVKGSVTDMEHAIKVLRAKENQWNKLLEKYTGTPANVWAKLHLGETWLTPKECLKYGLIDEIVEE